MFGCWAYMADLPGGRRRLHNDELHNALSLLHIIESGNSSVGIVTCYGRDCPVFESRWGKHFCVFSKTVQTVPGALPAPFAMVTGGQNNRVVKQKLVPNLRVSGAIPLFPLHGFESDNYTLHETLLGSGK
jgi:hypothetical protein